MPLNVCPVCDDGQENAIPEEKGPAPAYAGDTFEKEPAMGWVIVIVVLLVLLVLWLVRSPLFRARRSGQHPDHYDGGRGHNPYEGTGPGGI
jgi:hypothetical protein